MTALIFFLFFVAILAAATIDAIRDMQPQRRPPEWSIGRMIEPRH
jgi:hypothetical protein